MPEIVERTKRPVTVRTREWTGDNLDEMREFCGECFRLPLGWPKDPRITAEVYDRLHSTWIGVYTGHHVVCGVRGEFYPIEQEAMDETYVAVVPADAALAESERDGAYAQLRAACEDG